MCAVKGGVFQQVQVLSQPDSCFGDSRGKIMSKPEGQPVTLGSLVRKPGVRAKRREHIRRDVQQVYDEHHGIYGSCPR